MNLPQSASETSLNLVLVARKFWPMCGPGAQAVLNLAIELADQGHQVEVVTPRWEKNWPVHFQIQNVTVDRIVRPGQGPWGSFRYQRQLARCLTDKIERDKRAIDGVILFGLTDENLARSTALRNTQFMLRVDYRQTPYPQFHQLKNRKVLAALENVTALAADSDYTADQLLYYGVPGDKIHVVGDIVSPCDSPMTMTKRIEARAAISNAHPVLTIDPQQPLVVCGAPLDQDEGMADLVDAWKRVVDEQPKAKLWLLGDGPHGSRIWNRICSLNLVYSVIMPGYFDDLGSVFAAADLYVHPLRSGQACHVLLEALGNRIGCVATETSFTRHLVRNDESGWVVPPGSSARLAKAILQGLNNRDLRRRLGQAGHDRVSTTHHGSVVANRFLQLVHPSRTTTANPS